MKIILRNHSDLSNNILSTYQVDPFLGVVEPRVPILNLPSKQQNLYKVIKPENLLKSMQGNYLHFNRVDSYRDFPGADSNDGRQLLKDQSSNTETKFEKDPNFTAAHYYDQSRQRTYACCFSLENSDHIWESYALGSNKGTICVVFDFNKLRSMLNRSLQPGNAEIEYNGNKYKQIFSIDYGIVEYVEWKECRVNLESLPNPIKYTYLKDHAFAEEKELRIALSALGVWQFVSEDGSPMIFPEHLEMAFDFQKAVADEVIKKIEFSPDCNSEWLYAELNKVSIISRAKLVKKLEL
jgi:hypothetical protein